MADVTQIAVVVGMRCETINAAIRKVRRVGMGWTVSISTAHTIPQINPDVSTIWGYQVLYLLIAVKSMTAGLAHHSSINIVTSRAVRVLAAMMVGSLGSTRRRGRVTTIISTTVGSSAITTIVPSRVVRVLFGTLRKTLRHL